MLDHTEAAAVAAQFGVCELQVRRDHLISHLLAVLGRCFADDVVFFGGTALARTYLPAGRLSEDLDLITVPPRAELVADVEHALATGVRREYGQLSWTPALSAVTGSARPPAPWMFDRAPALADWRVQLGAQTRIAVEPDEALSVVKRAWESAPG